MSDDFKEVIVGCITAVLLLLILVLGIAVPGLISEKRNIEKEIILRQVELYGEPINLDDKQNKEGK